MTFLTRFEPFREFASLQNQLNRILQQEPLGRDESLLQTSFAPPVDIYEDEHSYTLKLEVPGIEEKDIDVKLENSTLTVSGERRFEKEEKEENYRRVERRYGSFVRSFTLPQTIDSESVAAEYDKGLLKIRLAKKAEAKPKQIKISVGSQQIDAVKAPSKAA
jgi:HSP20 family protein